MNEIVIEKNQTKGVGFKGEILSLCIFDCLPDVLETRVQRLPISIVMM
jgi:hypothetical protein